MALVKSVIRLDPAQKHGIVGIMGIGLGTEEDIMGDKTFGFSFILSRKQIMQAGFDLEREMLRDKAIPMMLAVFDELRNGELHGIQLSYERSKIPKPLFKSEEEFLEPSMENTPWLWKFDCVLKMEQLTHVRGIYDADVD